MQKIIPAICSALLLFSPLYAEINNPPPAYDADLFKKETPVFSFHGSFLYWRVQEGSLDYAIKMQHPSDANTAVYAQGKFHNATFNGDPGFRVALSYFRAPRYWEMWAQYTRFTTRGENTVHAPESADRYLNGTWPSVISGPLSEAKSNIHLNYNVADFFVDRFFVPNPHLRIRFLGGGAAAWINQNWTIHYFNAEGQESYLRNHWKFIGGGLRLGTTIDWYCGYDLYLTSLATCASLLGTYQNDAFQTASTQTYPVRDSHYSDVRPTFTVQAMFGLSWQKSFASTRMEIFGGYELNSWFNLQEVYRSEAGLSNSGKNINVNASMLALQGLTTRVTLDF